MDGIEELTNVIDNGLAQIRVEMGLLSIFFGIMFFGIIIAIMESRKQ